MNFFVVGANGKLGAKLCAYMQKKGFKFIPLGRKQTLDDKWISNVKTGDCVINLAAKLGTAFCEENRLNALLDNTFLASHVEKFIASKVNYIYISTDAVFGANPFKCIPTESSQPLPLNWYAASKRLGEIETLKNGGSVVRLPLLVDENDPSTLFGKLLSDLEQGIGINVADNVYNTPISYDDVACHLVEIILNWGDQLPEITHLTGNHYLSIAEIVFGISEKKGFKRRLINKFCLDDDSLMIKHGGLDTSILEAINYDLGV